MFHPLRNGGEIECVDTPKDSGELEDIRVRQGIPAEYLSAESLSKMFKQQQ